MKTLADLLQRRHVRSVAWFHTDHWEPWGAGVNERAINYVRAFTEQTRRSRYGRKATLFYLASPNYGFRKPTDSVGVWAEGDFAAFFERPVRVQQQIQEVLSELRSSTGVEFHVHVHHEQLTYNDGDWNSFHKELSRRTTPHLDRERFRTLLRFSLEMIRRDTGLPVESWAFVHGTWALNASDPHVCHIEDEISLLMEQGCWGDFSFPAGRSHCDPTIFEQPYTCTPTTGRKAYDTPDADLRTIDVGARSVTADRFLIWNSRCKHGSCSLDTYSEPRRLQDTGKLATVLLRDSPVINDVLYLKTHAHSMHPSYYEEGSRAPLQHPHVIALLERIERACDEARIPFVPTTVNAVRDELVRVDRRTQSWPHRVATAGIDCVVDAPSMGDKAPMSAGKSEWTIDWVNDFAVDFLSSWVNGHPDRLGAAGGYYLSLLTQRRFFNAYDVAVAKFASDHIDRKATFVELGHGFGELTVLLALRGFRAIGFECAVLRARGAVALVDALRERGMAVPPPTLVEGLFPPPADQLASTSPYSVFVCTNVTGNQVANNIDRIMDALGAFEELIIDTRKMGFHRDDRAQKALLSELEARNFEQIAVVYTTTDIDIRHFRRKMPS